jgi:hypothetical protein
VYVRGCVCGWITKHQFARQFLAHDISSLKSFQNKRIIQSIVFVGAFVGIEKAMGAFVGAFVGEGVTGALVGEGVTGAFVGEGVDLADFVPLALLLARVAQQPSKQ